MKHQPLLLSLLAWFEGEARDLPWRRTRDPYAIWVSEVMLQQTQVKTVLPYWQRWMRVLPNLQSLARAKPQRLHKLWEGLGYYTRVRNLQKAARLIVAEHGGKFPNRFEAVLALPGIGRYTAGAICSIAFNQPAPILDGNVIRVLTRIFAVAGNPKDPQANARLWDLSRQLVEDAAALEVAAAKGNPAAVAAPQTGAADHLGGFCSRLNQAIMELGALICTARNPQCSRCPLTSGCAAYHQGRAGEFPNPSPRAKASTRRFVAFVATRNGRLLVRQRPPGVVNAHLWEFPNVELARQDSDLEKAARQALGMPVAELAPLGTIKHSITRYHITLQAFRAGVNGGPHRPGAGARWLTRSQLRPLPFTSAHKKLLRLAHPAPGAPSNLRERR